MTGKTSAADSAGRRKAPRADDASRLPAGPSVLKQLAAAGIEGEEDFRWWLPFRYEDRSNPVPLSSAKPGMTACFRVGVAAIKSRSAYGRGVSITESIVKDASGTLHVVWFNQPWLGNSLKPGTEVFLYGKTALFSTKAGLRLQLENPEVEKIKGGKFEAVHTNRVAPVYHKAGSMSSKALRTLFFRYFKKAMVIAEVLPSSLLEEEGMIPRNIAFREAHFPGPTARIEELERYATPPQKRLIFEELLAFQWALVRSRSERRGCSGVVIQPLKETGDLLRSVLPFRLTGAQRRTLREIVKDLADDKPMYRLLHGDVGSGKTVVAFLAMFMAAHQGFQAAYMAPTEVLANQQYLKLKALAEGTGVSVGFLSGAVTGKARREIIGGLRKGLFKMIVGTHSLFQEGVEYDRLGLAVIDEQHRFGVEQRARLVAKGANPNVLIMTATPIPRSLAMTIYGDLDLSVIDEMPPGRKRVATLVRGESSRRRMEAFLRKEMDGGGQVFFVFPLVEESEAVDLKAATEAFKRLKEGAFRGYPAALLHGRMKAREKEGVMARVRNGEVKLLVATTVVEVGVDLPDASAIVVENADRFGLAQLHQLRGRVGRSGQKGYCVLIHPESIRPEALKRLEVMEQTSDGFEIAEADLQFRGPGEFGGTRQWGGGTFKIASPLRDHEILKRARSWAERLAHDSYPWEGDEKEVFEKWVEKWLATWGSYGRIG